MKAVFKYPLAGNKTNVIPFGDQSVICDVQWAGNDFSLYVEHVAVKSDPQSKQVTPTVGSFAEFRFFMSYEPIADDWMFFRTVSAKGWKKGGTPGMAMSYPTIWIYHVYYRLVAMKAPGDEEIAAALG